jgi:hypothetical protein
MSPLTTYLGGRVDDSLVDASARTGYSLGEIKPRTAHQQAAEYFQVCPFRNSIYIEHRMCFLVRLGVCTDAGTDLVDSFIMGLSPFL